MIGQRQAIVSEHYNGPSVAAAADMERFFFAGSRYVWQHFGPGVPADPSRCVDCRENVTPVDGAAAQEWTP